MQVNNLVVLTGRLVATPEIKTIPSGAKVASFCVAIDRRYAKQGEEKQTDFINCVAWDKRAEFVSKYFEKGNAISVVGSIQSRKYEDKDGNKRTAYEVKCDEVGFVTGSKNDRKEDRSEPDRNDEPQPSVDDGEADDEDLPF